MDLHEICNEQRTSEEPGRFLDGVQSPDLRLFSVVILFFLVVVGVLIERVESSISAEKSSLSEEVLEVRFPLPL